MKCNSFSLDGKTVLITGASSGIGRETAIQCSNMGASVIITGRNQERLSETASLMHKHPIKTFTGDICDQEFLNSVTENMDKLDGIVHSAGITRLVPFLFLEKSIMDEMISINYIQPVEMTRMLIKGKKLSKNSSVVFISSLAADYSSRGNSSYAASKAALNTMVKVMALELSKQRIRVNTILPGMVRTPMAEKYNFSEEDTKKDIQKYPLGYGEPIDVANACIYLLSDASKWVTGIKLIVDGGVSL